ncbi:auxilin-like protein 1 [Phalaenopsis equestris]|uniref:auxilin-like protein 1 n=1 Tax=Phalaenopsis equestris TaxID=78828 RepID=UPI0009E3E7BD|nr:auxilin-like protein 1 [Phalaenopsis equestris]
MEELRSARHWGKKPHGSAVFARPAYDDFLGRMPFPAQFEDYCEIFGTAASASSIPVLDLPPADDDFVAAGDSDRRVCVDYSEIFGGLSGGGFMVSYEELFGVSKRPGVSSLDGVAGWGVLSEQANEASEHLLEGYSKDHIEILEMEEVISVPNNTDETSSKQFSMSYHKTRCEIVDDLAIDKTNMAKLDAIHEFNFVVDASEPVIKTKNQQINTAITTTACTKSVTHDERQENEASFNSFSNAANSESLMVGQTSPRSNCASLLDTNQNEKYHSRSSSYHSASSGDISFSDVEYFNISEISLQTKPLQGPPPSRSPPQLIKKPDNPKMIHLNSNSDVEDGSLQIPKLKYHMLSNNGVTKIQAIDEQVEVNSCFYGNEIDPSSAAAASVAAVKAAMEQARARLKIAKELMDRKQDKYKRKVDQPKAMNCEQDEANYEVALRSCNKVMAANKLLKGNNSINVCAFPERQEIRNARMTTLNHEKKGRLPSSGENQRPMSSDNGFKSTEATCEFDDLPGEWKTEKQYNEVIRNDSLLNEVNDSFMHENEKKTKAVYACQDIYKDGINEEQAFEVLENKKSSEATCSIEKFENDHNLNGASMAYMKDSKEKVVNSIMEDFLITESASKLNEAYGCCLLDDTEKRCDANEDNTAENDGNLRNEGDVYKDNTTKDDYNSPNSFVGSCLCKDSENIIVSEGLCSSKTTDKMNMVEETNKFNEIVRQIECMNVTLCKADENNISMEEDDPNGLQENEEAYIFIENELEQEAIHNANGLEIRDASTELHEDELVEPDRNHELHNFAFLVAAESDCAKKESDHTLEVPVARNFVKNQFISASAKEVWQQSEESDAPEITLSSKEDDSPTKAPDMTEVSNAEVAENHKHSILTEEEENKKAVIEKVRDKERAIRLEEREREREREKDRIAVERANHDAHQRALVEARERAERIAVERVTAEARQRALADAREKAGKAAEAEKASRGARLRAERAAVERATEEARQRAIEKALAEKAANEARSRMRKGNETMPKAAYVKEGSETRLKSTSEILLNTQSQSSACSNNGQKSSNSCDTGGSESVLRCKARQERLQRTAERAANALAEKNMRDILAQREQAERDRLAESLDAEVRRWSTGKDGNLRALLSTLQYILGSDSGWQPVSLTDVLTAAAVKKAYRKSTLCVHPDKLQQRGATIQQKYICEKVFDLLKEAWNKFNSEER